MKTKWLVAGVTPGISPDRAEPATQEMILDVSLTNPLLSPHVNFLKIEWLVTDVTVVESPDRGERDILGMILGVFWPILATFVVGKPLCDVGIPS